MALAVLEPLAPNRELISAYNMEAGLSLGADDPGKGIASVDKALAAAEHFESEGDLPRLFEVAGLLWITQDRQRGMAYLERALAIALKLDHATRAANIYTNLALLYVDDYRFDAAQTLFDIAIPFAQERDLDFARSQLSSSLALLKMHRGEWQAADQLTLEALGRGPTSPARGSALLALGRLRARRGDSSAMEPLDEALDILLKQGFRQLEGSVRVARAEAAWLDGDCARAIDEARAGLELALSHRHAWYVGEMAFWLWRAGETPVLPTWAAQPYALHIQGDWRAAAEAWAALGCPYEKARALADGDVDAQREALEIFSRLQARSAATSLRTRLRAAGVGGLKHGPRVATRQHPLGVTRRQAEVLDQLVEGLTNAEIAARLHLSPKTVEKHVSALLARLEVNTRQEAIDKVRRTSAA
jgi:DNA-binding CsgD family transcriptional regulator/tetratricopeptide (TPR) repeat protein